MSDGARTARVSCLKGLEEPLGAELDALGVAHRPVPGGVLVDATAGVLARLDAGCFCADRVQIKLGRVKAASMESLASGVRSLPWKQVLDPRQDVRVVLRGNGAALRRGGAVGKKVELGIRDAMRGPRGMASGRPPGPHEVLVELEGSHAVVWADASGGPLHKRGWRPETVKAPLRETVAAAVLRAADWSPDEPLVDPMCGAGTFGIEAARRAAGLPVSLDGSTAWRRWPMYASAKVKGVAMPTGKAPILVYDRDPGAVKAAIRNARRGEVGARVRVEQGHFAELVPPGDRGLLVANPPWGRRIASREAMPKMVAAWRRALAAWDGWRIAWILPDPALFGSLGPGFRVVLRFRHGGVPVAVGLRDARVR